MDGGWSEWSEWSGCGAGMCGGDKKVRTRACTNPVPSEGGKICILPDKTLANFDNQTEECSGEYLFKEMPCYSQRFFSPIQLIISDFFLNKSRNYNFHMQLCAT